MATLVKSSLVVITNKEALAQLRTKLAFATSDHVTRDQIWVTQLRVEIERIRVLGASEEYQPLENEDIEKG